MSQENQERISILTEEEAHTEAKGILIQDVFRMVLMVERLAQAGEIKVNEYRDVADFYDRLKESVNKTFGKTFDDYMRSFNERLQAMVKKVNTDKTEDSKTDTQENV